MKFYPNEFVRLIKKGVAVGRRLMRYLKRIYEKNQKLKLISLGI